MRSNQSAKMHKAGFSPALLCSYFRSSGPLLMIISPAISVVKCRYPFFPMYNTEKPHNNEELTYNNNRLDYYIDANGYLHFITEYAGDIIISDGPLVKK